QRPLSQRRFSRPPVGICAMRPILGPFLGSFRFSPSPSPRLFFADRMPARANAVGCVDVMNEIRGEEPSGRRPSPHARPVFQGQLDSQIEDRLSLHSLPISAILTFLIVSRYNAYEPYCGQLGTSARDFVSRWCDDMLAGARA